MQDGFIVKRVSHLETEKAETTYLEITIAKKKFFEEILVTPNKALNKYDNLLSAGDWNINTLRPTWRWS